MSRDAPEGDHPQVAALRRFTLATGPGSGRGDAVGVEVHLVNHRAGDLGDVRRIAVVVAGGLRVPLDVLGALQLEDQTALRRLVRAGAGLGVHAAAGPLGDVLDVREHAVAGELGAAVLGGAGPQQERGGGLLAELADVAAARVHDLLVLRRARALLG